MREKRPLSLSNFAAMHHINPPTARAATTSSVASDKSRTVRGSQTLTAQAGIYGPAQHQELLAIRTNKRRQSMARGWNRASKTPTTPHGTHATIPLKAVSLLRKTSKTSKATSTSPTLLPKRDDTSMFAEVDRAAGPGAGVQRRIHISSRAAIAGQTAKMTDAAEHQKDQRVVPRAASSGIACADNDCEDQGDAFARNNDDDDMCASPPPPPLTTITIDIGDEDEDDDGGDCTSADIDEEQPTNYCSATAGNYENNESPHGQDTAMADEQPRSSEGGGVLYDNRQEEDITEMENGQPTLPRPILRQETSAPPAGTSTGSGRSLHVPSSRKSSRRISWNECVNYALIPTLAEMPSRIRRDMYYNADEEGAYRSATKDEIRALRRHPAVVRINQTAVVEHGNDLFAPRDYHRHSATLSDGNDDDDDETSLHHCTRGVEHHLLPRDLRRERSARIKGVVEAVLYHQYYQHERGMYDEESLAKVSQKRTRQFRRRARELAKADEAEMIAWLSQDMSAPQGANEDDDDDNCDDEARDYPMDQSSKSLRIEEADLPPISTTASASTTFKDKFDNNFNNEVAVDEGNDEEDGHPNHHHGDDFADVNLDSYTSLDQRLEQQYHREMSERLMARICR